MTRAYSDGVHAALHATAWTLGALTVLLLVAGLLTLAWLAADPLYRRAGAAWARTRVQRRQASSGRIPGI